MPSERDLFIAFIHSSKLPDSDAIISAFEHYLDILYAKNLIVNMVSRRMSKQEYWLYHFLDSLLILKVMDSLSGKVLDFGSGGGLPGIPLKIIHPELHMTMLDAVRKKVNCLNEMIEELHLRDCTAVWSRLEDFTSAGTAHSYDYIVCRAVQMEQRFIAPMRRLLKPQGKVIFYKAMKTDDVESFCPLQAHDVSLPELGMRKLIIVPAQSLPIK